MVDDWLLEHLAKVSALSCVLIVLYFLVYSIWRITQMPNYPWNWNDWQWPLGGGRNAVEIYRKPAEMPFTISMVDRSKEDMGQCTFTIQYLKGKTPPQISVIWGPSALYIMKLINSPWQTLRKELMMGELEEDQWNCLLNDASSANDATPLNYFILHRLRYPELERMQGIGEETSSTALNNSHSSVNLAVTPPVEFDWSLLKNQFRYPAAVFITSEVSNDQEFSIRGIIQLLHVRNEVFPKASSTLSQYIKMNNGQSHILQPLYVIDDHRLDEDELESATGDGATHTDLPPEPFSDILCSVCQVSLVTRVIIPCRHVCLCKLCFEKVESCPICRGPILYYFRTREEPGMTDLSSLSDNDTEGLTWWQRVERWNERFSDAMGLIRQY